MNKTRDPIKITTLEDLQNEKALLRSKIAASEIKLKDNYRDMVEKLSPVMKVIRFISGNKLLGAGESGNTGRENETGNIKLSSLMSTLAFELFSGKRFWDNKKKDIFSTLIDYGIDQAFNLFKKKEK